MKLIATDEAGINHELLNSGDFRDGFFAIRAGIVVDDVKYFHIERMVKRAKNELLPGIDWENQELHASEIWDSKHEKFQSFSFQKKRNFFDEMLQLAAKLRLSPFIAVKEKTKNIDAQQKSIELNVLEQTFILAADTVLGRNQSVGILVADGSDKSTNTGLENSLRSLAEWRHTGKQSTGSTLPFSTRYSLESSSLFLVDTVHYVDSKKSAALQMVDIIAYCAKRVLEYEYRLLKGLPAIPNMVPCSPYGWGYLTNQPLSEALLAFHIPRLSDVTFGYFYEINGEADEWDRAYFPQKSQSFRNVIDQSALTWPVIIPNSGIADSDQPTS